MSTSRTRKTQAPKDTVNKELQTRNISSSPFYTLHCPQDAVLAERGGGALTVRLDAVGRVRVPLLRGIVHLEARVRELLLIALVHVAEHDLARVRLVLLHAHLG